MKWNWKQDKSFPKGQGYRAKNGMIELQVWQVFDVGYSKKDEPIWLTAVDIAVSDEYTGSLYPKNDYDLEKAKLFAEKSAERWIQKFMKSFK